MSNKFFPSRQCLTSKMLLGCTLILSLILTTTAIAAYKAPANPSRPKTPTGSNSSRSNGCGDGQTTLTALAPLAYIGQTVSSQPTFAWFVPTAQTREIEFTLYEYVDNKVKLIHKKQTQSSPGIMKLSLTDEKISLSVGSKYSWQVALLCNPNHPSEDLIANAEIEVLAMPSRLKNTLSQTKDLSKRSELYAEQGFWYDALAEMLNNPAKDSSILDLLSELSKLELEESNRISEIAFKKDAKQQSLRLQQIVNFQKFGKSEPRNKYNIKL